MRKVRTQLLAIAAVLTLSSTAYAADMAVKAPLPPPAPTCIWCGWYVGFNVGWIGLEGGQTVGTPIANDGTNGAAFPYAGLAAAGATGSFGRTATFLGGGQFGYNWQPVGSNWVLGFETDFDGVARTSSDTPINNTFPATGFTTPLVSNITANQSFDWFGTVRGRVGYAFGNLMFFGTGGLAYAKTNDTVTIQEAIVPLGACPACNPGSLTITQSDTRTGWTAGGGAEWMFAQNWSLKVEGLWYDLGTVTANGVLRIPNTGGTIFETTGVQYTDHVRGAIARVGVNYHF